MDAAKKTELEKRAVLGLAAVFVVVFVMGPLKSLGLFGSGSTTQRPAGGVDAVPMAKSVGGILREGWDKLDQQAESVSTQAARTPAAAPQAAAAYTAFELRDPLKSLLPRPAEPARADAGAAGIVEEQQPAPPTLRVEGLLWGSPEPQAIIDGRLYGVHDDVSGAKILAIDQSGVTVEHLGKPVVYSTATASAR